MSTRPSLAAEHRTVIGKKVNSLRRQGILPAVIFGDGQPSEPVQISALDWEILRRHQVTRNTLLDLTVGGAKAAAGAGPVASRRTRAAASRSTWTSRS